MLKLAIFDLDGTLGDTLPLCIEAFRQAAKQIGGLTYSDEEILNQFGVDEVGVLANLLPEADTQTVQYAASEFERIYQELHPAMAPKPFPGAIELLDSLKQSGVRLALVTGKAIGTADITLKAFGLESYFEYFGYGSPQGVIKDLCIERILQDTGIDANHAIYLGDAVADVIACKKVPIRIVGAAWAETGDALALRQACADYVLNDFSEVLPLLKSL